MAPSSSPPLRFKLVLASVAILIALVLCETGARLVFPRPPDDTRQPQIVYRYDAEVGYVISPSQQGWSNDGFMTVNALGFRGEEVATPKPAGRFRVVLIGDSVTAGLGVADTETFAVQLQQILRQHQSNVDVVNMAVSGYNTRQEVALLRRYADQLQPDLVLVGFYVNDVWGSVDDGPSNDGGTRIVAERPQPGQILHMDVSGGSWWNRQLRRSRAVYVIGRVVTRVTNRGEWGSSRFALEQTMLQDGENPDIERGWSNVERALDSLAELSRGRFDVGLLALPCKEQVTRQYSGQKYATRLSAIAQKQSFVLIDPLPAMAAEQSRRELFIPYDRNHENPEGHRVIAQAIADGINARRPIASDRRSSASGVGMAASRSRG